MATARLSQDSGPGSTAGSNASSDGFDRSPLHGEGGGGAEEEETARDDGPEQAGEGDKVDESTAVKAEPKSAK